MFIIHFLLFIHFVIYFIMRITIINNSGTHDFVETFKCFWRGGRAKTHKKLLTAIN